MHSLLAYRLMLAFLITHELDAVAHHEWRILFFTNFLPDDQGRLLFIWLHVPLFMLVWVLQDRPWFRNALSAFAVIHVGLHVALINHPAYEFNNLSSWLWIGGAGVFGLFSLISNCARPSAPRLPA